MVDALILAAAAAAAAALAAAAGSVWIGRRMGRRPDGGAETPTARMARDLMVLSQLLAERLAKLWQADGGPAGGGGSDAVYHHVRESTETILRQAGASDKTAAAVGALTAKQVRPGPIGSADGAAPGPQRAGRP